MTKMFDINLFVKMEINMKFEISTIYYCFFW